MKGPFEPFIAEEQEAPNTMSGSRRRIKYHLKIGGIICLSTIIVIFLILHTWPHKTTYVQGNKFKISDGSERIQESLVSLDVTSKSLLFNVKGVKENYLQIFFPHELLKAYSDVSVSCPKHAFVDRHSTHEEDKFIGVEQNFSSMCLSFEDGIQAAVYNTIVGDLQCHRVYWITNQTDSIIQNHIVLDNDLWYGGGVLNEQRWPLQRVNVPLQPYITNEFSWTEKKVKFDAFIEPYFISTNGVVIILDSYFPLFVSINSNNDKKMIFKSAFQPPYSAETYKGVLSLSFTVCKDLTAQKAHMRLAPLRLSSELLKSPALDLLKYPIWSSQSLGMKKYDESEVISFVKKTNPKQFIFMDNYLPEQGVFAFNDNKFPHSHQLIMEWKSSLHLTTGVEIHPYVPGPNSSQFHPNHEIRFKGSEEIYGSPSLLALGNEKAMKRYELQIDDLKSIGVCTILFSQGHEGSIFPSNIVQSDLVTNKTLTHPNKYIKEFNDFASHTASEGINSILGTAYKAQEYNLLVYAGPFHSNWDHIKGLKAVIPTTITLGLLGYPFVLLGPVGGIHHAGVTEVPQETIPPSRDLYLRWLSLAIYLPALQLAWPPGRIGPNLHEHTKKMLEFRQNVLWPKYFSKAIEEASQFGIPIIRPLWWVSPGDMTAQYIDCEFMLGSNLLVAPVLNQMQTGRQIYLPEGWNWHDNLRDTVHTGGLWLNNYPVNAFEIATFERLDIQH